MSQFPFDTVVSRASLWLYPTVDVPQRSVFLTRLLYFWNLNRFILKWLELYLQECHFLLNVQKAYLYMLMQNNIVQFLDGEKSVLSSRLRTKLSKWGRYLCFWSLQCCNHLNEGFYELLSPPFSLCSHIFTSLDIFMHWREQGVLEAVFWTKTNYSNSNLHLQPMGKICLTKRWVEAYQALNFSIQKAVVGGLLPHLALMSQASLVVMAYSSSRSIESPALLITWVFLCKRLKTLCVEKPEKPCSTVHDRCTTMLWSMNG